MQRRQFLQSVSTTTLLAAASGTARAFAQPADNVDVREVASRVEMFIDRWLIERESNVTLRLHPPERREIVMTLDQPWEGASSAYYTVFQEEGIIRLYYRASGTYQRGQRSAINFCYAESRDGIHFERPQLSLYEFNGSGANNIIFQHAVAQDNFTPFLDANPHADPTQRYKAVVSSGGGKLYAAASPDGKNWKLIQSDPISTDGSFDSLNVAYWDAQLGAYRMFSRYLDVPSLTTNAERNRAVWETGTSANWVRAIQSSTSLDFVHWQPAQPHQYAADAPREHFYTNATTPCPGAEHILLAFPKRFFEPRRLVPPEEHEGAGLSDGVIISSRDGLHWDRTFTEAWLRPGRDKRNWTQRSNMVAWGILPLTDDEFTMYASEHYEWPDNRLRRLVVRRHGFASVHATAAVGEMLTKPLSYRGERLMLNFATSAGGSIRVEMQDEHGQPLAGRSLDECPEIFGDEIAQTVIWKSGAGVSAWQGRPVRLKFELRDADLFALQFS